MPDRPAAALPVDVHAARLRLGLSQAKLAAALGVSKLTVLRWEHGRSRPGAAAVEQLTRLVAGPEVAVVDNLPAAGEDELVGRSEALAAVHSALRDARLVTISGTGGVGKTSLAVAAAGGERERFDDGCWFVDFSALTEADLVPRAVAGTLGLRELPGRTPLESLVTQLGEKRALLVFDNCEHLRAAIASLTRETLRACPGIRILATSRERLAVAGELPIALEPLTLAAPDDVSVEGVLAATAAQLYVRRVAARVAGYSLGADDARYVAQLCARLDGLPLAVELAAAWGGILTPREINERLDDRFRLLERGDSTRPARHQTLRAAIDWSVALLSAPEQKLFARLSVFAGSFDLAAAEAVGSFSTDGERTNVLPLLAGLIEKSLVVARARETRTRYSLLESLKAYGRDLLGRFDELQPTLDGFAGHYTEAASGVRKRVRAGIRTDLVSGISGDVENYRSAMQWLSEQRRWSDYFTIAVGIWNYWDLIGAGGEARLWIERGLREAEAGTVPNALRARALGCLGQSLWRLGSQSEAEELHLQSLELFEEAADADGIGWAEVNLGGVAYARSDFAGARRRWESALLAYRSLGDDRFVAILLNNLGLIADRDGDSARGLALLTESADIRRNLGDAAGLTSSLLNLASIAGRSGDDRAVRSLAGEALGIARGLDQRLQTGVALEELARADYRQDDLGGAEEKAREALSQFVAGGYRAEEASVRSLLGVLASDRGETVESAANHAVALTARRGLGSAIEIGDSLLAIASLAIAAGSPMFAAELLGSVSTILTNATLPPGAVDYAKVESLARAALSPDGFLDRFNLGALRPLDEVVAEALRWVNDAPMRSPTGAASSGRLAAPMAGGPMGRLTPRETAVLGRLVAGDSNKEIAVAMHLSVRTVERHLSNLYGRIGARGRADAIRIALERELERTRAD